MVSFWMTVFGIFYSSCQEYFTNQKCRRNVVGRTLATPSLTLRALWFLGGAGGGIGLGLDVEGVALEVGFGVSAV